MTHPDMMYKMVNARHEDIRNAEAARHFAKQAQGEQPNRAKELLDHVVALTRRIGAKASEATQTSEVPQIKFGGEQAG